MGLFNFFSKQFIDVIGWQDDSNDTLVYRFDRGDNAIKNGAKLTVREGQMVVFVNQGQTADVFGPGMYELVTANLPLLSDLNHWDHGFKSPFQADVYFFNMRRFGDLKWGTRNPIMLRDPEFGAVRMRAFGSYEMSIGDPAKLLVKVVGTDGHFTMDEISDRLRNIIVSQFSTALAQSQIPALALAANYQQLGGIMAETLAPEFAEYGVQLEDFWVENISFPPAVEQALDRRSSMEVVGDLDRYFRFQQADAMGQAAGANNAMGAGMGAAMGAALGANMQQQNTGVQAGHSMGGGALSPRAPTPPPLDDDAPSFHLGLDGEVQGPFELAQIADMVQAGRIDASTLAWTAGMADWQAMGEIGPLASVLESAPPPIPGPRR